MKVPLYHVIVLAFSLGLLFSCSERETGTQGQTPLQEQRDRDQTFTGDRQDPQSPRQIKQGDQDKSLPAGREVQIVGTVERIADGFAIWTLTDTIRVEGADLSGMVGKNVRVSGYLWEDGGRACINVDKIQKLE
jgi:hypothetical protein